MFIYYIRLALLSYRRNPVLSSLMVLAVAIGVGAYMVIFTLNYFMGGDPIPHKSAQLFHVQLDYGDPAVADFEPPPQLTYIDAIALLDLSSEHPRTANSKFVGVVEPQNRDIRPFSVSGRGNFSDFFTMFDIPFQYGSGWDREADENRQQVIVLSSELNDQLFGGSNSVGETVHLHGYNFTVVGVLDRWSPMPKFYDVNNGPFDPIEEAYIPWHLIVALRMDRSGNTNCWAAPEGDGFQAFLNAECAWIQFWVELQDSAARDDYLNLVDNYAAEQKSFGRLQQPVDKRLFDVNEWMVEQEVVPDETRILSALAAMLLAVCLLNTVGLLLSKFLGKAPEIGVRQALGAHKGSLFIQHVIEAGFIGALGGVLGLGVAALGMEGVKILMGDLIVSDWMQLNLTVMLVTIALAIVCTVIAGLYPIWRACNINPAIHLKLQ
ncbi:ABC transporter permease [Pseudohongiella sp.]|uniref:ABC3 transporter permease protein domain-containing protein n=1 Tax=marine sediment metagenome TaxID=412755 RepID=A0A0F9V576_9ZZZZ|nr:ABC transporter permease [Pseudohongiella sp.]HDZ08887.1 ABC transporter permease [Pseudohongiella sp.]HEA64035.1 ABC transporter permease [Pseudohongiella sp.]